MSYEIPDNSSLLFLTNALDCERALNLDLLLSNMLALAFFWYPAPSTQTQEDQSALLDVTDVMEYVFGISKVRIFFGTHQRVQGVMSRAT